MPTTYLADLKARVAAYLNRDATLFTVGSVDNLLQAINDARRSAQQVYSFNALRTFGFLQVGSSAVQWKSQVSSTVNMLTPMPMKTIERVWTFTTSGSRYIPQRPVRVIKTGDLTRGLAEAQAGSDSGYDPGVCLIFVGENCYSYGFSDSTILLIEGVKKLGDLTGAPADETDFFILSGQTWLLLKAVQNLNVFLKEDIRVQVSQVMLREAWDALITEDAAQAGMAGSLENLD